MIKYFFIFLFFGYLLFVNSQQNPKNDYPFTEITKIGDPFMNQEIGLKNWVYFRIVVNTVIPDFQNTDELRILATPLSGDVDLYVKSSNFPTTPQCDDCWKSTGPSGEVVVIKKTDPMWPVGDDPTLYIGIYAPSSVSRFQLNTYVKDKSYMTLFTGVSQTGSIGELGYVYFQYDLVGTHDISISLTPIVGDPDVFVSTTNPHPSPEDNDWYSAGFNLEWIDIKTTDPKFKPDTKYYIGVRGFTETFFSLVLSMPDQYNLLMEGAPLSGKVVKDAYIYYEFYLTAGQTQVLNFQVNSLTAESDADIYVVYNKMDPKPSKDNWDWKSMKTGVDLVTISNAQPGWYYIGVFGFHDSSFRITALTEATTQLLTDSVPQRGYVIPNEYKYYKFYNPDSDAGLTVSLIPDAKFPIPTDITFYTGIGANTRPISEPGKYWKKPEIIGEDSILTVPSPTPVGTLYIGVISRFDTNFTISVKTNQSHTILQDGVTSFWNHVPEGSYRYFIFDDPRPKLDTTVSILPTGGDADLFMSQLKPFPKIDDATWSSTSWGENPDFITVRTDDPKRIQSQRFYISVRGVKESYFSIVAYSSDTTVELKDGSSLSGAVDVSKYTYFKFNVKYRGGVTINLSLKNTDGKYDADIYASTKTEKPNKDVYEWKSTNAGDEIISIPSADAGYIYIGVYGVKAPEAQQIGFSIQASQDYSQIPLNFDSLMGFGKAGTIKHYMCYVYSNEGTLIPSVTLINGRTTLYISTNETGYAGPDNYDWMIDSWPQNTLAIPSTDPKFKTGKWSFGVFSNRDSDFYIAVSHTSQTMQATLSVNVPIGGTAAHGNPVYYRYKIPYEEPTTTVSEDYYLDIRVYSGEVEIFVDQKTDVLPNPHSFTFSTKVSSAALLKMNKENLKQGYLYIATFGTQQQNLNQYEITITRGDTPRVLPQDQVLDLTLDIRGYKFFRILNSHDHTLNIYADSCENEMAPAIFASTDTEYPTENQRSFQSTPTNNGYSSYLYGDVSGKDLSYASVVSLTKNGLSSSVYMTTSLDSRPIVAVGILEGIKNFRGDLILRFTKAHRNYLKETVMTYDVYVNDLDYKEGKIAPFNTFTACSVRNNMKRLGSVSHSDEGSDFVTFPLNSLDLSKKYRIQVLVSDKYGLSAVYKSAYVINGNVVYEENNDYYVGFSLIIILVLFFSFIMYFSIGFFINIVRGKRGFEIIPHSQTWVDLPLLVFDGIRFIFTCGGSIKIFDLISKKDKYKKFRDENINSVNAPTESFRPVASSNIIVERDEDEEDDDDEEGGKITKQPVSGYGAL